MPETRLEIAERHVAAFSRIVALQEKIVRGLDGMGDVEGVRIGCLLLDSFRRTLSLAVEHRDRLLRETRRSS